eukprot:TRINITY_DN10502_c0_g1_i1.p1 TRINITY_DN10502_c0_g1~~TRINITY_DN10502_c0_g1_i1.p1  ORF type:complete len:781 (+),score=119.63 TRINITY_DN10502_c0_g1_i1:223-2565(+)
MRLLLCFSLVLLGDGQASRHNDIQAVLSDMGALLPLTALSHSQGVAIVAYKATLDIGSPKQRVSLILDTGSSALAVALPQCQTREQQGCTAGGVGFEPLDSSSYHRPRHQHKHKVTMTYDQGGWTGYRGKDLVSFPVDNVSSRQSVPPPFAPPISTHRPTDAIAADIPALRFDVMADHHRRHAERTRHDGTQRHPPAKPHPYASVRQGMLANLDNNPTEYPSHPPLSAAHSSALPSGMLSEAIPLDPRMQGGAVLGRATPPAATFPTRSSTTSSGAFSSSTSLPYSIPSPASTVAKHARAADSFSSGTVPDRLPADESSPSPSLVNEPARLHHLRHSPGLTSVRADSDTLVHLDGPVANRRPPSRGKLQAQPHRATTDRGIKHRLTVNSIQEAWTIFTVNGHQGVLGMSPRADLLSEHASFALHLSEVDAQLWLATGNTSHQAQQWRRLQSAFNGTAVGLISSPKSLHYRVPFTAIHVGTHHVPLPSLPVRNPEAVHRQIPRYHAIVDSGTTFLLLPAEMRQSVVRHMSALVEVNPAIWSDFCVRTHPSRWPGLQLELGNGAWITLQGHDYLVQQSPGFYCLGFGISSDRNEVILGLTALKSRWIAINPLSAQLLMASRDTPSLSPPETQDLCDWAREELADYAHDVPDCRSDCSASVTGRSYCHSANAELYIQGQRYDYSHLRITWLGLTRSRVYQSANVELVLTCNADVYYPLQCSVKLEVAWGFTLFLALVAAILVRSILVTTRELNRLQLEQQAQEEVAVRGKVSDGLTAGVIADK